MESNEVCLLLDIGLYAGADVLRRCLGEAKSDPVCRVLTLDSESARPTDWDDVVDEILRCRRCITL